MCHSSGLLAVFCGVSEVSLFPKVSDPVEFFEEQRGRSAGPLPFSFPE
jgi:hypothetical protein